MSILGRFEQALGRRVSWAFESHQVKVAPHAFADANAFYSRADHGLLFGYFPSRDGEGTVFTCLSHDIIAHETTHALLDGLRERYNDPSSPDQAADIVALLSVFALRDVVDFALGGRDAKTIAKSRLTPERLKASALLRLAEEMGGELQGIRGAALRQSAELPPSPRYLTLPAYEEPHLRGEVLVAAVMNAFLEIWANRVSTLGDARSRSYDRGRVVEEGSRAADRLLTLCIRALDYCPPVDVQFGDFLSACLTSDARLAPDDSPFGIRAALVKHFRAYGIEPRSHAEDGLWVQAPRGLDYRNCHRESLQHEPDEVFRFLWDNRARLNLFPDAFTKVISVRPCVRVAPDGFVLRETVAEYVQIVSLFASELTSVQLQKPAELDDAREVRLYGGGVLIFDEFGRLLYHVHKRVQSRQQQSRLDYLVKHGYFRGDGPRAGDFARLHRGRSMSRRQDPKEVW
jgi:hypothetical protein